MNATLDKEIQNTIERVRHISSQNHGPSINHAADGYTRETIAEMNEIASDLTIIQIKLGLLRAMHHEGSITEAEFLSTIGRLRRH